MSTTDSNRKLSINPAFKKQLSRLQNIAKEELNIRISSHKMITDKQYRLTVLSELDGLGSELLTEQVNQLRHTSVHIQSESIEMMEQAETEQKRESLLLSIFIALFFIFIVATFVSWQNGYLTINIDPFSERAGIQTTGIIAQQNAEQATVIPSKQVTLPAAERSITLRLHGSNTIGEKVAPALLEAYLTSLSVEKMGWLQGDIALERELQYVLNGKVYAIQLHAHGSSTGFKSLLADEADMSMSSRKIYRSEVSALKASKGDLSTAEQEIIIGLDGLAIIVNPENPLDNISSQLLAKVFAGEINNWQQLGGADIAINRYVRDENSGTWDTFNSLILRENNKQLTANSQRIESSHELSSLIAQDVAGIGFIGLPYVGNSKALAVSAAGKSTATYPTHFTVSTEDYPLSRRLYLYTPSHDNQMARQFSEFVISEQGQVVVGKAGLISQRIKLEEAYRVKNAPSIYNEYAQIASRLSVNFRFKSGSDELDNKAKHDIKRLLGYLEEHPGRRIVLMGFSDSWEDPKMNLLLSIDRASQLEKRLNSYGVSVTAVEGFGEKLPIASNKTAQGRSKNRRVEVWVF